MNRRNFLIGSSIAIGALGLGATYWPERWRYIVVHHSAGSYGNIELIQRVHRQRQPHDPIDAIPYHFIIGNGNGLGLGTVATDWRWQYQIWGAHLTAANVKRNALGIGICLIGNYEKAQVPPQQYKSLLNLTRNLMQKYNIPPENVTGHGMTKGESTKCPGKNFPMEQFKRDINA